MDNNNKQLMLSFWQGEYRVVYQMDKVECKGCKEAEIIGQEGAYNERQAVWAFAHW